jgi:hypothetical protein
MGIMFELYYTFEISKKRFEWSDMDGRGRRGRFFVFEPLTPGNACGNLKI